MSPVPLSPRPARTSRSWGELLVRCPPPALVCANQPLPGRATYCVSPSRTSVRAPATTGASCLSRVPLLPPCACTSGDSGKLPVTCLPPAPASTHEPRPGRAACYMFFSRPGLRAQATTGAVQRRTRSAVRHSTHSVQLHNPALTVQRDTTHMCSEGHHTLNRAAQHARCSTARHTQSRAVRRTEQWSTARRPECIVKHSDVECSAHGAVRHNTRNVVQCAAKCIAAQHTRRSAVHSTMQCGSAQAVHCSAKHNAVRSTECGSTTQHMQCGAAQPARAMRRKTHRAEQHSMHSVVRFAAQCSAKQHAQ